MKNLILTFIISLFFISSAYAIAPKNKRFKVYCEKTPYARVCTVEDKQTGDRFIVATTYGGGSVSVTTLEKNPHLRK